MSGKRITKAINALKFFLKSLPNDSYFNVISFGTRYNALYPKSVRTTNEYVKSADQIISRYEADLGGT